MKLLLDTHIFLWSLLEPDKLGKTLANQLESPKNELWLSSLSVWEIIVLAVKGKVELQPDAVSWIRTALKKAPVREVTIPHEVAIRSRQLDLPHRDPADRFLAATADVYSLVFASAD